MKFCITEEDENFYIEEDCENYKIVCDIVVVGVVFLFVLLLKCKDTEA